MIKKYNLHPTVRSGLNQVPRETLHVCKADAENVEYLYDNVPRGHLFHTITKAIDVAEDYFDVYVWPGTWTEGATIAITQDHLKLLTACPPYAGHKTDLRGYGSFSGTVLSVDGHGCEIGGFRITPYNDLTSYSIKLAITKWMGGCWIHDIWHYSAPTGINTCGIMVGYNADLTHSTYAACDIQITDNIFFKGRTKIAMENCPRCHVLRNKFVSIGSGADGTLPYVDIRVNKTQSQAGGFNCCHIEDNTFYDAENGAHYGIQTDYNKGAGDIEPGDMIVHNNQFTGFDASGSAITDHDQHILGRNFYGATAIGS